MKKLICSACVMAMMSLTPFEVCSAAADGSVTYCWDGHELQKTAQVEIDSDAFASSMPTIDGSQMAPTIAPSSAAPKKKENPYAVRVMSDGRIYGSPDAIKLIKDLPNWNAKQASVHEIKALLELVIGLRSLSFIPYGIECYVEVLGEVMNCIRMHPNWENSPSEKEEVIHALKMARHVLAKAIILPL